MESDVIALAKSLYQASPAERVSLLRKEVPASRIADLVNAMQISRERLLGMLNLPSATVRRKIRQGAMLPADQAERVIGMERLIGQVVIIMEGSDDSRKFDAARWVGDWLEQPVAALGGMKPADLMDTMTGQMQVSSLLSQLQAGVFA